jgi:hypothetical protein
MNNFIALKIHENHFKLIEKSSECFYGTWGSFMAIA